MQKHSIPTPAFFISSSTGLDKGKGYIDVSTIDAGTAQVGTEAATLNA